MTTKYEGAGASVVAATAAVHGLAPIDTALSHAMRSHISAAGQLVRVGSETVRTRVHRADVHAATAFTETLGDPDDLAVASEDSRAKVRAAVAGNPAADADLVVRVVEEEQLLGRTTPAVVSLANLPPEQAWYVLTLPGVATRVANETDVSRGPVRDGMLASCARACAWRDPELWLNTLAAVTRDDVAVNATNLLGDPDVSLPPVWPLDLAVTLTPSRTAELIADTSNSYVVGDTLADRVRLLAHIVDNGSAERQSLSAARTLYALASHVLDADPSDDTATAEAFASCYDTAVGTLEQLRLRRTFSPPPATPLSKTLAAVLASAGYAADGPDRLRADRWVAHTLTRSEYGEATHAVALRVRDAALRGELDISALANSGGPFGRAAAAAVTDDTHTRADVAAEGTKGVLTILQPTVDDVAELLRRGHPLLDVAAVADTTGDGPLPPGALTSLLRVYGSRWREIGLTDSVTSMAERAAAGAHPDEFWPLLAAHGPASDTVCRRTVLTHMVAEALRRDDLDEDLRHALVLEYRHEWVEPEFMARLLDTGALRPSEVVEFVADDTDAAAAVAMSAVYDDQRPSEQAVATINAAIAHLPLPVSTRPGSALAEAAAYYIRERVGDDPERWEMAFTVLNRGWDLTVGDLVDTVLAMDTTDN